MATTNRAALLTKAHKVLKKHYSAPPVSTRPLLEELLFACCLENARGEAAHKAYATLCESFFDWNEVRVSSIRELASVLSALPEPERVADAVKRTLQGVFDKTYTFELESLRKLAMGKATAMLEGFGVSPFALAHVTLTVLEGSAFPLDRGSLEALIVIGVLTEAEAAKGSFGSIERAIPKNKRHEFVMLLHELGAELVANPYSTNLHKILLEIAPDAKGRLPKRGKVEEPPKPIKGVPAKGTARTAVPEKAHPGKPGEKPAAEKAGDKSGKLTAGKHAAEKPHDKHEKHDKPTAEEAKKGAAKKAPTKKADEESHKPTKPAAAKSPAKAKAASHKKKPGAARQKPR